MTSDQVLNEIDNYIRTVRGLLAFLNFYRYDDTTKKMRVGVTILQGWKLVRPDLKEGEKGHTVTPDFGVMGSVGLPVIGEVKITLPKKKEEWIKTVRQLKSYDAKFSNWPSNPDVIENHDIVLLISADFSRPFSDFYKEKKSVEGEFVRKFGIVEFSEQERRRRFFNFRLEEGAFSDADLTQKLHNGVMVPEDVFISIYSTVKLYDGKPHPAYLQFLIWQHVLFDRIAPEKLKALRKNSKYPVVLSVEEIIDKLDKFFTLQSVKGNGTNFTAKHPKLPKREWVMEACDFFVKAKEASWVDKEKKKIEINFKKYDDVQRHLVDKFVEQAPAEGQQELPLA